MPNSLITGTGRYVPERVVDNATIAALCASTPEWIVERTGIERRHFAAPGETASVMGAHAARRALGQAGRQPADVDCVLFATLSPDYLFPGCACLLQAQLGLREVPCFDVRNQCSGFLYALSMADAFVRAGSYRCILVVGAELQSTGLDLSERGRELAVLFGDGAGAVLVEASEAPGRGIVCSHLGADGHCAQELWCEGPASSRFPERIDAGMLAEGVQFPHMNGRTVFRHAIQRMKESIETVLAKGGAELADVHLVVPHQANQRITDMLARLLGIGSDRVFSNIAEVGNTTAASIPIALADCVAQGRLQEGKLVVLTAFGSGFTWAATLLRW